MKKTIIYAVLFVSGFCSLSFTETNLENGNEIIDITLVETLPELGLSASEPLNPNLLNNNRFIALLGATLDDDNYYELARMGFEQRYHQLYLILERRVNMLSREEMGEIVDGLDIELKDLQKIKWNDDLVSYNKHLACRYYLNSDCIQQTLDQKTQIQGNYTSNFKLIQRYIDIYTNYPNEITIPYPDELYMYSELPAYANFIKILDVSLSMGLIEIAEDRIEEGIEYFIQQQSIINQMIKVDENNSKSLINIMIAVAMQQILDQYTDALLGSEYRKKLLLSSNIEQLFKLQQNYRDEIIQSIIEVNKFEQLLEIRALFNKVDTLESLFVFFQGDPNMSLSVEEELSFIVKNFWKLRKNEDKFSIDFLSVLKRTIKDYRGTIDTKKFKYNDEYSYATYLAYFIKKYPTGQELNRTYREFIVPFWDQAQKNINYSELEQMNEEYCKTLINKLVKEFICTMDNKLYYLVRGETQLNYHNMVYLKYLIIKDNIQDENIPEFLKSQGDIAIDPITKEPFVWNVEKRTISLPLTESKYLPASIRLAVSNDPEIKYLQVTIP